MDVDNESEDNFQEEEEVEEIPKPKASSKPSNKPPQKPKAKSNANEIVSDGDADEKPKPKPKPKYAAFHAPLGATLTMPQLCPVQESFPGAAQSWLERDSRRITRLLSRPVVRLYRRAGQLGSRGGSGFGEALRRVC